MVTAKSADVEQSTKRKEGNVYRHRHTIKTNLSDEVWGRSGHALDVLSPKKSASCLIWSRDLPQHATLRWSLAASSLVVAQQNVRQVTP